MLRLTLSAAELSLLAAHAGIALPPGLLPPAAAAAAAPDAWPTSADAVLRRRGLVDGDDTPIAAVAASLTVLATPAVTVRIEVTLPHQARTSLYTMSGGLGAALRQLDDGELELALFPAWELSTELTRAVPDPNPVAHRTEPAGVRQTAPVAAGQAIADRAAAQVYAPQTSASPVATRRDCPSPPAGGARGALQATVTGAAGTTFGTVEWLATEAGWRGLQSVPAHGGSPGTSVHAGELGSWLAPALDSALAASR